MLLKLLNYLSEVALKYEACSTADLIRQINRVKREILKVDGPNGLLLNAVKAAINELPLDVQHAKDVISKRMKTFVVELEEAKKEVILRGSKVIEDYDVVMTHCHSHLVWNACLEAHAKGKRFKVFVTETRPRFDGYSTVKRLSQAGIPTTLIVDSAAGYYLRSKSVSNVMLGLDCISSDGYIYNKIGTYPICACAHENKIPVYFLTTKSKIVQERKHEIDQVFFEKGEIASTKEFPNVTIQSPVYDVVPMKYADFIITENKVTKA